MVVISMRERKAVIRTWRAWLLATLPKKKRRHRCFDSRESHDLYRMPESFRAFCRIVSLTAANTSRMFVVSVACVRLHGEC